MKHNSRNGLLALVLVSITALAGCDFQAVQDALDDFNVIVALEEVHTTVSVKFIDAASDSFVDIPITMKFDGNQTGQIIDTFSDPLTEARVKGGLGSFGIRNSVVPSGGNPVSIFITGSASGYQTGSATVDINQVGATEITIHMIRSGQAVQGAASGSSSTALTGGAVQQPTVTSTSGGASTNQTAASLSLPAGTSARTTSGQLATGSLATQVSFFSNASGNGASAFPGGFTPVVQNSAGAKTRQSMTTAGFVDVRVTDSGGNRITQFNPPIPLSVTIPASTINQLVGRTIQNGDQIQVFSYNESAGTWFAEGTTTISGPGQNGNYTATFLTGHLSTWNFGYSGQGCSSGMFNLNRNGTLGAVTLRASSTDGSWVSSDITVPAANSTFVVSGAPSNLNGYVIHNSEGVQVGSGSGSICNATGTATLPTPAPNEITVTFSLNFGSNCPRLNIANLGPAITVYYRKVNQPASASKSFLISDANLTKSQGTISGGSITVPGLQSGSSYVFQASIDNKPNERIEMITGPNISLNVAADVDGICIK
ncbi:MAG: hypothetical protein O3B41_05345 [Bacteroidetes bacterium]|nr:hypothetical protein [Bacteroidota bacterium]